MTYLEHWMALAARIRGLTDAGQLYAQFQTSSTSDSYGAGKLLGEQCGSVLAAMEEFAKAHERTLPPEARAALGKFLGGHPGKVIRGPAPTWSSMSRLNAYSSGEAWRDFRQLRHVGRDPPRLV